MIFVQQRAFSALFYYSPEPRNRSGSGAFANRRLAGAVAALMPRRLVPVAAMFKTHSEESLPQAPQRSFIGPWPLGGSVWLETVRAAYWRFTLALRQWMRKRNSGLKMQQNEPEDHFGSLRHAGGLAAENDRHRECEQPRPGIRFRGRPAWTYLSIAPGTVYQALATGASYAGAMAKVNQHSRRCKTVIPLILTKGRIYHFPIAGLFYSQK